MGFFDILGKVVAPVAKLAKPVANVLSSTGVLGPIGAGASAVLDLVSNNVAPELTDIFNAEKAEENIDRAYNFQREMNQSQQNFNALEAQKARDFNALEAQKTRDFNSSEAALQRNWQQEMYEQQRDDNREWNDVGAQMQRAMAAGMNPLAFEQGTMSLGNVGSGASASAGAAASSPMASIHPNGAMSLANPQLNPFTQSQLRLNNAQAQSLEEENRRKNELHPYEIKTAQGNLYLIGADVKLKEGQLQEIEAKIPLYQTELKKLDEEIKQIIVGRQISEKELSKWDERYNAECKRFELENDVIIANKKEIYQRITNMVTQNDVAKAGLVSQKLQNYLDGMEVKMVVDNEEAILKYKWDVQKGQYDIILDEQNKRKRIGEWRNSDEWYNFALVKQLDFLSMLSESVGMNANFSNSNSTSTSRSVNKSTSSTVSDVFMHNGN